MKTVMLATAATALVLAGSLAEAQPNPSQSNDQNKARAGRAVSPQQGKGSQATRDAAGGRQVGAPTGGQGSHRNQSSQTTGGSTGGRQGGATSGGQGTLRNQGGQTTDGSTGGRQGGATSGGQGTHRNQGGQTTGGSTGGRQGGATWGGQGSRHNQGGQGGHDRRGDYRKWGGYEVGGVMHSRRRVDRYRYPGNESYRHFRHGDRMPSWERLGRYFIGDFLALGLAAPAYGQRWVRYGPDAVLIDATTGEVLDTVYGVYDDGSAVPPPPLEPEAAPPPPSQSWAPPSQKLYDNWNTAACEFTDAATLDVRRSMRLDRMDLWVNWGADEQVINYRVTLQGQEIATGQLRRGDCDPYQAAWCAATDTPATDMEPGLYTVQIDHEALCQNQQSGGDGFIRAWGRWR